MCVCVCVRVHVCVYVCMNHACVQVHMPSCYYSNVVNGCLVYCEKMI